jgi:hypothetical protein
MTELMDTIARIDSISDFDRAEIDYLLECCDDRHLIVRYRAYGKLNSIDRQRIVLSRRDEELQHRGIPLQQGDVVWSVYQSGLCYDDSMYSIYDYQNETGENVYGEPARVDIYDLWNNGIAHKFISTHIDRESAETVMHQTIKEILMRDEYPYSGYYDLNLWVEEISQQDVYHLAREYGLTDLPPPQSSRSVKLNSWIDDDEDEEEIYLRGREKDNLRDYAIDILKRLNVEEHYNLIDRIYSTLFGRLAYICKETVKEQTYFIPRSC